MTKSQKLREIATEILRMYEEDGTLAPHEDNTDIENRRIHHVMDRLGWLLEQMP